MAEIVWNCLIKPESEREPGMIVPEEAVDMLSVAPTQSDTIHEKHFGLFRLFSFKSLNNNSKKLPSIPEVSQERESLDTQPHLETECNNDKKL